MAKQKKPLSPLKRSLRTKLLLTSGILLMTIPLLFYLNQNFQLMFNVPKVAEIKRTFVASPPTHISIPTVSINLPVEQTVIQNNTWTVGQYGASHLNVSASPGEAGPIILYSHNTNNRFGPIRWLNKGAAITVTTANGHKYTYSVIDRKIVKPDELSVFFSRKTETLYLYTCDGFADLDRYIVIAEPSKVASHSAR